MKIDAGAPIVSGKSGILLRLLKLDRIKGIDYNNCLDLGAGNGAYSLELRNKIRQVTAFDINLAYLKNLNSKHDASISIVNGESAGLPFKNNSFESIFLIETVEHFVELEKTVSEIYRVSKPGAVINITVPNKYFILETHHIYLFGKTVDGRYFPFLPMVDFIFKRIGAARRFSVKSLKNVFNDKQFQLLGYDYMLPPFDNSKLGQKYLKPLSGFIESCKLIFLYPTLIVVFKRI